MYNVRAHRFKLIIAVILAVAVACTAFGKTFFVYFVNNAKTVVIL